MRNSKVILAKNINLDNSYTNVLDYSESDMLTLLRDDDNLVYENDTYSFIRENENQINIKANYQTCLSANYLAFQNTNYGGKWFFAFITDVKYNSNESTIVTFEVDVFTTWFNDITLKPCFVEREHVNSDIAGEHTVPEGLETGEYIIRSSGNIDLNDTLQAKSIVVAVTADDDLFPQYPYSYYGGVVSGCVYLEFSGLNIASFGTFLKKMVAHNKKDEIIGIFMYPTFLLDLEGYQIYFDTVRVDCNIVNTTYEADDYQIPIGTKPTTIGSYTPKNKKLLTKDYIYLLTDNGVGGTKVYNFEDFDTSGSQGVMYFDCISSVCISGSIMFTPRNYKGSSGINLLESFAGGKFPVGSWSNDAYTNWLTQTGANRTFTYVKDVAGVTIGVGTTIAGLMTGNPLFLTSGASMAISGLTSGIGDTIDNIQAKSEAKKAPDELKGNETLGNVIYGVTRLIPKYYHMSIKEEYAKIIDDFWSAYGYKVNSFKIPNVTGRTYWNYVKIGSCDDIGNGTIPNKYKDALNRIFRVGTTIWHSHANIGNYNLTNSIVS